MATPVLLLITGFSFMFSHPDSTGVTISNLLEDQSLISVYLLLPNADELINIPLQTPIQPGETEELIFPWGYIRRVIFNTDHGRVYYQSDFAASSNPDTISITLARKEFGGVFDRIYGTLPIIMKNNSNVMIASVQILGDSVPHGNILGSNPLMPGEFLRLWVNSTGPYTVLFQDVNGYFSEELTTMSNPDTIYSVENRIFFHNGKELSLQGTGFSFTVVNCISSQTILGVEAFDEQGYSLVYVDLIEDPLETWDRIVMYAPAPPAFVSCVDAFNRTYSLEQPDSLTGNYSFDLLALDFDFSFPEGH